MTLVRPAEDARADSQDLALRNSSASAHGENVNGAIQSVFFAVAHIPFASLRPVPGVHETMLSRACGVLPPASELFEASDASCVSIDADLAAHVEALLSRVEMPQVYVSPFWTVLMRICRIWRDATDARSSHPDTLMTTSRSGCLLPTPKSECAVSPAKSRKPRILLKIQPARDAEQPSGEGDIDDIVAALLDGSLCAAQISTETLARTVAAHMAGRHIAPAVGALFLRADNSAESERALLSLYMVLCVGCDEKRIVRGLSCIAEMLPAAGESCASRTALHPAVLECCMSSLQGFLFSADHLPIDDVQAIALASAVFTAMRGSARPESMLDLLCRMAQTSGPVRQHILELALLPVSEENPAPALAWIVHSDHCSALAYLICLDSALQLQSGAWSGSPLMPHLRALVERVAADGASASPGELLATLIPDACTLCTRPEWVSAAVVLCACAATIMRTLASRKDVRPEGRIRLLEALGRCAATMRVCEVSGNCGSASVLYSAVSDTSRWPFVDAERLASAVAGSVEASATNAECSRTAFTAALGAMFRSAGTGSERAVALMLQLAAAGPASTAVAVRSRALRELVRVVSRPALFVESSHCETQVTDGIGGSPALSVLADLAPRLQEMDTLATADALLSNESFVRTLLRFGDDSSPLVREASLEFVNLLLAPGSSGLNAVLRSAAVDMLVRKLGDPSAGVRKRAIRLAGDVLALGCIGWDFSESTALRAALIVLSERYDGNSTAREAVIVHWLLPAATTWKALTAGDAAELKLHVASLTADFARVISWAESRECTTALQAFISHASSALAVVYELCGAIVDALFETLVTAMNKTSPAVADAASASDAAAGSALPPAASLEAVRAILGALATFFGEDGCAGLGAERLAGHFRLLSGLVVLDDSRIVLHALRLIRTALRRGDRLLFRQTPDLAPNMLRLVLRGSEDIVRTGLECLCELAAVSPAVRGQLDTLASRLMAFVRDRLSVSERDREECTPSNTAIALLPPHVAASVARAVYSLGILFREAAERRWSSEDWPLRFDDVVPLLIACMEGVRLTDAPHTEAPHVFAAMAAAELLVAEPARAVQHAAAFGGRVISAGLTSPSPAARLAIVRGFQMALDRANRVRTVATFSANDASSDYSSALCTVFQSFAPALCAVCVRGSRQCRGEEGVDEQMDQAPSLATVGSGSPKQDMQLMQLTDASGTLMLQMLRDGLSHPQYAVPGILALWCAVPDPTSPSVAEMPPALAALVCAAHGHICAAGAEVIEAHDSFVGMALYPAMRTLRAMLGPAAIGSRSVMPDDAPEAQSHSVAHRLFDSLRTRTRRVDLLNALLRELHASLPGIASSDSQAPEELLQSARFVVEVLATLQFRAIDEVAHVMRRIAEILALYEDIDGLYDGDVLSKCTLDGVCLKPSEGDYLCPAALSDTSPSVAKRPSDPTAAPETSAPEYERVAGRSVRADVVLMGLILVLRLSSHLSHTYRLSLNQAETLLQPAANKRVSSTFVQPILSGGGEGVLGPLPADRSIEPMRAEAASLAQGRSIVFGAGGTGGHPGHSRKRRSAPAKRKRPVRARTVDGVVSDVSDSPSSDSDFF